MRPDNARTQLLIIDPQNDFCDLPPSQLAPNLSPALPVPGAHADMLRVAGIIARGGSGLTGISITLDSHHRIDIAHPAFWMDAAGLPVKPFTQISKADVEQGNYAPRDASGVDGGVQRGLQAYRLNAQATADKALAAGYPKLQAQLGEHSFRAMAWAFWRAEPPVRGDLACWGGQLAGFLAAQDGMDEALCDLARLEWAAHRAESAADTELDVASLDLLGSSEPAHVRLLLRPGVCLLRVQAAAWDWWRDASPSASGLLQSVVIWRQGWRAEARCVGAGDWHLMQALAAGTDLDTALQRATSAEPDFDFSVWLQAALRDAWLLGAALHRSSPDKD